MEIKLYGLGKSKEYRGGIGYYTILYVPILYRSGLRKLLMRKSIDDSGKILEVQFLLVRLLSELYYYIIFKNRRSFLGSR